MRVYLDEVKFNAKQTVYFVMVDGKTYDRFTVNGRYQLTFSEQADVSNGYREALEYHGVREPDNTGLRL